MSRILVVYYSRTGTTKCVATEIAKALEGDVEEIVDHTPRSGLVGYMRSGFEGSFHKVTEIDPVALDPTGYDLVVLGSPVWSASMSSPMRAFIRHHRGALKAVAFFCTCGGRGGERVLEQMAAESGKAPAASLILREADVARGSVGMAIRGFADRILGSFQSGQVESPPAAQAHAPAA